MLAKWITHATVDLDLSCFMLVLSKEASRESSMCDPFCENPAFLARAILTLLAAIPFKSLQVRNSNLTPRRGERHLSLPSLRLRRCPSPSDDPTPLTFYFPALKTFSSPLQLQVSSRRLPPHSSVWGMKMSVLSFPNRSGIIIL